jgi:hypothetical protein
VTVAEPTLEEIEDRALSVLVAARVAAHDANHEPMLTLEEACTLLGLDYNELLDEVDAERRAHR